MEEKKPFTFRDLKNILIGRSRDLQDRGLFHHLSLIAFFAWVGLGADGLSSSCYGPQESFLALGSHTHLSLIVGLLTVGTILVISASYSQLIELFPSGGGGYLVASKLLSPTAGMVAGCALLIDYVLTITVSIASGADAIFSLVPVDFAILKVPFAVFILILLILMNLRGVKESVLPLVPIFILFILTHAFIIIYTLLTHVPSFPSIVTGLQTDTTSTINQLGAFGIIFLILRAYSMGAGTYTGIEAISNAVTILREPRVRTAKKTMAYMAISLSVVVMGLMLGYLLFNVSLVEGKTLNAVLIENTTAHWSKPWAGTFVLLTLFAEAALLFVAAQTGFLGGPKVLSNMALDRWFPTRFSAISDRLVSQNGVLIMGISAIILLLLTKGSVQLLVVLYAINVFITFVLSQMGMVRHWWNERRRHRSWKRKVAVNGAGLVLSAFILISTVIIKFNDGGWMTLAVTGALILLAIGTKQHYFKTALLLKRLNTLTTAVSQEMLQARPSVPPPYDLKGKTAVVFVSGFNGMGLHTLMNVIRFFKGTFRNFVFVQVGIIDAGNFKGEAELHHLQAKSQEDIERYVLYMQSQGFYAEGHHAVGVDVVEESEKIAIGIAAKYPDAVFFGGQLVFPRDSFVNRLFHNYTVFSLQKHLYRQGLLFVILPIRV
ncbi:MAG: APC family permease [Candidatus Omnitrophica bacterium]|nr:APC family permease [Candidatus Omnitrophota bacterium]